MMTNCLANTGAGTLPLLAVGACILVVGAVVLAIIRYRTGAGTGTGGRGHSAATIALVVAALTGLGAVQLAGPASPATAASASSVTAQYPNCPPAANAPTPPPAQPVIGNDQDVTFTSGDVTFAASYRGPTDPSRPVPAVVIVVGTGAVDRNGNAPTLDTEAYEWLADVMSANGIASLRYDKLGTGATGLGPYTDDPDAMLPLGYDQLRVQPVRDALSFVAAQPGVDPDRILLLGHSEGGAASLIVATDPGDAPELAGLLLIEPAYSHILDIVGTQFRVQMEAAVTGGAMTAQDEQTLNDWMNAGVAEIRAGTPPYPAPGPVPLPGATDITAVYQNTILTNMYGSDPAQMVITHAYRTLYGKQFDAVDPLLLSPQVSIPTLITCGTKDFNTPCGDGTPGSGVIAVADNFAPGVASFQQIPDMVHILRDVGSADVSQPVDQITYPFSSVLEATIGDWVARFRSPSP